MTDINPNPQGAETNPQGAEPNARGQPVQTFTQEDVNRIVQERLAREKKSAPSESEMKEFNEWKEGQKTEQQKILELLRKSTAHHRENAFLRQVQKWK